MLIHQDRIPIRIHQHEVRGGPVVVSSAAGFGVRPRAFMVFVAAHPLKFASVFLLPSQPGLKVSVFLGNMPWNRPILALSFCRTTQFLDWSPATILKPSFS